MSPPDQAPLIELSDDEIARIVSGLVLAMFLAAIDQTLISVALLSIGRDVGDIDLMPWVMSGYLVASTIASPIYGKLSDLFGRWPMLATALGTYLVASLLCALSTSMTQLIIFRVMQGMGSGALIALGHTVSADIAPGPKRGRYQGYFSGVYAGASMLGPFVGGYITEYLSWRGVFIVNLPMGLLAFLLARRVMRRLPRGGRKRPIDYPGALLLAAGLAALMIALTRLGQGVSWHAGSTLALVGAAAVLLLLCAWREQRAPEPLLPPDLFSNRVTVACFAVLSLSFFALIGQSVILPMWLQSVPGNGLDRVALLMLPFTLSTPLSAFFAGRHISRGGSMRRHMIAGTGLTGVGAALLALASPASALLFEVGMCVSGAGIGMVMPSALITLQSTVARERLGIATASAGLFRSLGSAVGVALLSSVLFASLGAGPDAHSSGAAALRDALLDDAHAGELDRAFRITFWVVAIDSLIAWLVALTTPAERR